MQAAFELKLLITLEDSAEIQTLRELFALLTDSIDPVKGQSTAYKQTTMGYCGLKLTEQQKELIRNIYEQIKIPDE